MINNIPLNTLYQFDNNKYIWSVLRSCTRGGVLGYIKSYEIFTYDAFGQIYCEWSGFLITSNSMKFTIYSNDIDASMIYEIKAKLIEAPDFIYKQVYENEKKLNRFLKGNFNL